MARRWILTGQEGFEVSLKYEQELEIPLESDLLPNEVLVKLHAASLNHRELFIASPDSISGPIAPSVVPGCDGAGIVEAVGKSVKDFKQGDRVVTHLCPTAVEARGDEAYSTFADTSRMLGIGIDGTLRSHGVFSESALVHAPASLDWLQASTLTCTYTTAWNALFGLESKKAGPGSTVLVQGTGGVSIAVLQMAVAVGATVVATTSSEAKATRLRELGAKHVVNYKRNPDSWCKEARGFTENEEGFDIVVDIGGNETLPQSLAAVRVDGVVIVAGGVGENADPVPLFAVLIHTCIVRGLLGGSRAQFKQLVKFIDEQSIKPVVDDFVFELAETKEAYRRLNEKKHLSKVVIKID